MSKGKRRLIKSPFVIMPLVGLLAVGAWFQFGPEDEEEPAETTAATEQLVAASLGTMEQTVEAEGTVEAAETEDLSFTSSGEVTSVEVVAGDVVKAGDVLATIDDAELQSSLAEAEASVADAEASYEELLDAEEEDDEDDSEDESDDESDDVTEAQLDASESSLEVARDQLEAAEEALADAKLVASIDGTVASVDITVGEELVSGTGGTDTTGSESGSGDSSADLGSGDTGMIGGTTTDTDSESTSHIQLVSTNQYSVELTFDDTDVANLEVGQIAEVSVSSGSSSAFGAFPGGGAFTIPGLTTEEDTEEEEEETTTTDEAAAEGMVTEVGTVADASSGVASYPVTVVFSDDGGELIPGATASVQITYAETGEVVQVPSQAVTTEGETSTVTVDLDGEAGGETEERTVTTGMTADSMTEITSGLEEGEQVVISLGGGAGGGGGGFTPPEGFEMPEGGGMPAASEEGGS